MQTWHRRIFCGGQVNQSLSTFHISSIIVKQVFWGFFPSVYTTMRSALSSITSERERLKQFMDHEACPPTSPQLVGLKNALATVGENTLTQTLPHRKPANIHQGFHYTSDFHFSQMSFSPTLLTRRDTWVSLSQGQPAADVIPAHLTPFNTHSLESLPSV